MAGTAFDRAGGFDLPPDQGRAKTMALADAVRRFVRPGMALHVCWSQARPNAALLELVRQFAGRDPKFTLSCVGFANSQVALVAAGLVARLVTAYAGESYPAGGVNPLFQRAIDSGAVAIENWSQWTIVARLMAGALGLPFLPTRSLAGSDLAREHEGRGFAMVDDPFGGGRTGVIAPLRPDLAIVQGVAADAFGNVIMSPPYGEGQWGALAAREGVIACVERIVPTAEIRRYSSLVRIPGHAVVAVCRAPFGSHPYGSYSGGFAAAPSYVEDAAFIAEVAAASRDPAAFRAWLDEWVLGVADHEAYLARLGTARLDALVAGADPERWRSELAAIDGVDDPGWSPEEAMIVVSARRMAARVREAGHRVVLAGIGASNLAGWLAERKLAAEGIDVALMSEIGIYGYAPRPGEPFVFSTRNIATARLLTDVSVTLGTLVSGADNRCLGALGAALVDRRGNIATTRDNRGRFIVGSGGGNDIASAAREVLVTVKHGSNRLVDTVAHVTSPGDAVRTIVTTRAVLARAAADQEFALVAVIPQPGETLAAAIEQARGGCGWPLAVADDIAAELPPSAEDLAFLRLCDPRRTFLGAPAAAAGPSRGASRTS